MHSEAVSESTPAGAAARVLDAKWLRQLCLEAGADDAGFVELKRASLANERPHIERAFPRTRSLLSIVLRMNRDDIRSPARSVANNEFHQQTEAANDVARRIVAALEREGIRALNPSAGFPMEADRWMTERIWVVSHTTSSWAGLPTGPKPWPTAAMARTIAGA